MLSTLWWFLKNKLLKTTTQIIVFQILENASDVFQYY